MAFAEIEPRLLALAPARSVWPREGDLVAWLQDDERLEALGRETGTSLDPLGTEERVSGGRVDLLCADEATGGLVVVEAQLGAADADHVARALRYASEYGANRAVLVAEGFPPDIIDAVNGGSRALEVLHLVSLLVLRDAERGDWSASIVGAAGYVPRVGRRRREAGGRTGSGPPMRIAAPGGAEAFVAEALGGGDPASVRIESPPAWLEAGSALVALWPVRPADGDLTATVAKAASEEGRAAGGILVALEERSAAAAGKVAALSDWTDQEVAAFVRHAGRGGRVALRPFDWQALARRPGSAAAASKAERAAFWDRVAGRMARGTGTKARKAASLGRSSFNVRYVLGRFGVSMAVLYSPRLRRLCAEVRVHSAEPALARNRYGQLRRFAGEIEAGLPGSLEAQWLGNRTRQDAMVLRLVWDRPVGGEGPYRDLSLADGLADAVLGAEAALLPYVGKMVDFLW